MHPQARQDKLTIVALPDETLVYDRACNKCHCLNRTAALVWRRCDGNTCEAELARIVHAELGLPNDEAIVRLALEQLERRRLLAQPLRPLAEARRQGRRDWLKKLAVTAASLPLVMTLSAKAASTQASQGLAAASAHQSMTACNGQTSGVTVGCVNLCASIGANSANAVCTSGGCSCG